jgi:hypothetical protein
MHLDSPDVEIAPLGLLGQPAASQTLLAGRFDEDQCFEVADVVRRAGGEIVTNVDESWTRPRNAVRRQMWGSTLGREGVHS